MAERNLRRRAAEAAAAKATFDAGVAKKAWAAEAAAAKATFDSGVAKKAVAGPAERFRSMRGVTYSSVDGATLLEEIMPEFGAESTRYIVVGDGWGLRNTERLRTRLAHLKYRGGPILSVDPAFSERERKSVKERFRQDNALLRAHAELWTAKALNARHPTAVRYLARRAEDVGLAALAPAGAIGVVMEHAHASASDFLARIRAVAPSARIYAAVAPCCKPGIRHPTESFPIRGPARWHLQHPRLPAGHPRAATIALLQLQRKRLLSKANAKSKPSARGDAKIDTATRQRALADAAKLDKVIARYT